MVYNKFLRVLLVLITIAFVVTTTTACNHSGQSPMDGVDKYLIDAANKQTENRLIQIAVSEALIENSRFEDALGIIISMQFDLDKITLLEKMIGKTDEMSDTTEKVRIVIDISKNVNSIRDIGLRAALIGALIPSLIAIGEQETAKQYSEQLLQLTKNVTNDYELLAVINAIAHSVCSLRDQDRIIQTMHELLKLSDNIIDLRNRLTAYRTIPTILSCVNDPELIENTFSKLMTQSETVPDDFLISAVIVEIAKSLSSIEDNQLSKRIIDRLMESANRINRESEKTIVYSQIAHASIQISMPDTVKRILNDIRTAVSWFSRNDLKVFSYCSISSAAKQIGELDIAREMLQLAMLVANINTEPFERGEAFLELAKKWAELEADILAITMLHRSIEAVEEIQRHDVRSATYARILNVLESLKRDEISKPILPYLLRSIITIEDEFSKGRALYSFARTAIAYKDTILATQALTEIINLSDSLKDYSQISEIQGGIAHISGLLQDVDTAEKSLLKAIDDSEKIIHVEERYYAYDKIFQIVGEINLWTYGRQTIERLTNRDDKTLSFASFYKAWAYNSQSSIN